MNNDSLLFQLEPAMLLDAFLYNLPPGFKSCFVELNGEQIPAFATDFDLLLTADKPVRNFVQLVSNFLPDKFCNFILRPRTLFIGTTVSEFALFPAELNLQELKPALLQKMAKEHVKYLIVKDIAAEVPFLSAEENVLADKICSSLAAAGFVLIEGQALAYVPINFTSEAEFLARFSKSHRSDFRRKLRKRSDLELQVISTGDPRFRSSDKIDSFYRLYENVYKQSEIHFDKLSKPFFEKVLNDDTAGGVVFEYSYQGHCIGYFLCFDRGDYVVDKYMGAEYPAFREFNLYFISWFDILQYALEHSCKFAIFGWTSPEIKAYLGAKFVFTKHAIYPANPILRHGLTHLSGIFESDRKTIEQYKANRRRGDKQCKN